uniref:hypothetical protein n=1 Tax=Flavobacterium sp. TaxID=239 RepID=UPI00404AE597
MKKSKIVIKKASLTNDVLSLTLDGKNDKQFNVSDIKKFSISKAKTPRVLFLIIPVLMLLGYYIHSFLYLALIPLGIYIAYLKFYYRHYKLTLIENSGMKYKFTFYKKLRSVLFDIRLKVKYMLLTN